MRLIVTRFSQMEAKQADALYSVEQLSASVAFLSLTGDLM